MKFTTSFDIEIAAKIGLPEAILYNWLIEKTAFLEAMKLTYFFRDDIWWVLIDETVRESVLPFLSVSQLARTLTNLANKEYVTLREDESGGTLVNVKHKVEVVQKIRRRKDATQTEEVQQNVPETVSYLKVFEDGHEEVVEEKLGTIINDLLNTFKYINLGYAAFFKRKVYRTTFENLITQYPIEVLFKLLKVVPQTNKMMYAPIITNPLEFERKLPTLIAFIQRAQREKTNDFKISI